jgi:hypothetical protein
LNKWLRDGHKSTLYKWLVSLDGEFLENKNAKSTVNAFEED